MDQISDLLFLIFQHCVMPWLLPVFILAALVGLSGGRSSTVFRRCINLSFSLLRTAFRVARDIIAALTTRKVTRRSPPRNNHLDG